MAVITIVGAGMMGSALAFPARENGHEVRLTGTHLDREIIESRALRMCELFRSVGGGWIAKDYPTYGDIGVQEEWAGWARDVIIRNSAL